MQADNSTATPQQCSVRTPDLELGGAVVADHKKEKGETLVIELLE